MECDTLPVPSNASEIHQQLKQIKAPRLPFLFPSILSSSRIETKNLDTLSQPKRTVEFEVNPVLQLAKGTLARELPLALTKSFFHIRDLMPVNLKMDVNSGER